MSSSESEHLSFSSSAEASDIASDIELDDSTIIPDTDVSSTAVWHDSDDESLTTDLSSHSKLKKLRSNFDETVVSGTVLSSKLQEQYTKLVNTKVTWPTTLNDLSSSKLPLVCSATWSLKSSIPASFSCHSARASLNSWNFPYTYKGVLTSNQSKSCSLKFISTSCFGSTFSDRSLNLYRYLGNSSSEILTSIRLPDLPSPQLSLVGGKGICHGVRPFFYVADFNCASISKQITKPLTGTDSGLQHVSTNHNDVMTLITKDQKVTLVDGHNFMKISSIKTVGKPVACSFNQNINFPNSFSIVTSNGRLSIYDLRNSLIPILSRDTNDSCSSVAFSNNLLATGNQSGVVSLWEVNGSKFEQLKEFQNLVTPIDSVQFSCDAKFLIFSSAKSRSGCRVVNTSDLISSSNFPPFELKKSTVTCFDWSSNGGY
ncbi:hypothetical protein GEMRC1_001419 [Eukaryota sp. GEM-RC1]